MEASLSVKNIGLRGVAVADTKISTIDGKTSALIYRGYRIEDLAALSNFPETAYLLLQGVLPKREELARFESALCEARALPDFIVDSLRHWPRNAAPMDVLQASVPLLAMDDGNPADESREANVRRAITVLARFPAIIVAWHRIREGKDLLPPDPCLSHTANFLWQLTGCTPTHSMTRDLDISMILQAEHTFNASTFACREVVSTRAHLYAGVAAGVGALSGDLHGGANTRVLELLLQLEPRLRTVDDIAAWARERLDRGERIMGMGHPVYKTFDPRAVILKEIARRLALEMEQERLFDWLSTLEDVCMEEFERRGKTTIKANVDYYSGLVHFLLGVPVDLMTPLFAMSLVTGWCAHIIEERYGEAQRKPAIYRPDADYVGHYCGPLGCTYTPIDER